MIHKIKSKPKLIYLIILALFIFSSGLNSKNNRDFDLSLFRKIVKENSRILTIDADIVQNIQSPGSMPEIFKGRYRADEKGRFRIDYNKPEKQIVINNGTRLYWYYINEKLLYIITEMAGIAPRKDPMGEFSKKIDSRFYVKYLGKTMYGLFDITENFILVDKEKGISINLWIEKNKNVIVKKIVLDKNNREILKEIYSGYEKVNNIYFPMKLVVFVRTEKGVTRNSTYYKNVFLNKKISGKVFKYNFPKDVKRVDYKNK